MSRFLDDELERFKKQTADTIAHLEAEERKKKLITQIEGLLPPRDTDELNAEADNIEKPSVTPGPSKEPLKKPKVGFRDAAQALDAAADLFRRKMRAESDAFTSAATNLSRAKMDSVIESKERYDDKVFDILLKDETFKAYNEAFSFIPSEAWLIKHDIDNRMKTDDVIQMHLDALNIISGMTIDTMFDKSAYMGRLSSALEEAIRNVRKRQGVDEGIIDIITASIGGLYMIKDRIDYLNHRPHPCNAKFFRFVETGNRTNLIVCFFGVMKGLQALEVEMGVDLMTKWLLKDIIGV